MAENVENALSSWLKGAKRVVVAGIGNPIRSDDYVGLYIVQALQGKVCSDVCLLECEAVPESFLLDIEEFSPTHVLLIDAAIRGYKPGEASFVNFDDVPAFAAISSHALPLRLFCEYTERSTSAKVRLLLVEPANTELGECLSQDVAATAEKLTKLLLDLLSRLSCA